MTLARTRFVGVVVGLAFASALVGYHAQLALSRPHAACRSLDGLGGASHVWLLPFSALALVSLVLLARGLLLDLRVRRGAVLLVLCCAAVGWLVARGAGATTVAHGRQHALETELLVSLRGTASEAGQGAAPLPSSRAQDMPSPRPMGAVRWSVRFEFSPELEGQVASVGLSRSSGEMVYCESRLVLPARGQFTVDGTAASHADRPARAVLGPVGIVSEATGVTWSVTEDGLSRGIAHFVLQSTAEWRGTIVDLTGAPVSGLPVLLRFDSSSARLYATAEQRLRGSLVSGRAFGTAVTDQAGRFHVRGPESPEGRSVAVLSEEPGWRVLAPELVRRHREQLGVRDHRVPGDVADVWLAVRVLVECVRVATDPPGQCVTSELTDLAAAIARSVLVPPPPGLVEAPVPPDLGLADGDERVIGHWWTTRERAAELVGAPGRWIDLHSVGFRPAGGTAMFCTPGADCPVTHHLRSQRTGPAAPLALRFVGPRAVPLPRQGMSVGVAIKDMAEQHSGSTALRFETDGLAMTKPLPPGRYELSCEWLSEPVQLVPGDEQEVTVGRLSCVEVRAGTGPGHEWSDVNLAVAASDKDDYAGFSARGTGRAWSVGSERIVVVLTETTDSAVRIWYQSPFERLFVRVRGGDARVGGRSVERKHDVEQGQIVVVDLAPWPSGT